MCSILLLLAFNNLSLSIEDGILLNGVWCCGVRSNDMWGFDGAIFGESSCSCIIVNHRDWKWKYSDGYKQEIWINGIIIDVTFDM